MKSMTKELSVGLRLTFTEVVQAALAKFANNRNEDVLVFSNTEVNCTNQPCYVGIDEAGRGPVLGPMVYAIFAVTADEDKMRAMGKAGQSLKKIEENPPTLLDTIKKLNDSKQLSEKVRDEIFAKFLEMGENVAWGLKIISPTTISGESLKRQKISLNEVSHTAAMELIDGLDNRCVNMSRIYVDTVGPMDKYQKKLELKFPQYKFKVDKKADSKYKPVSAASICAKVIRDEVIKEWKFTGERKVKIGARKWGSGYPGDDVTKRFLRSNVDPIFGFPNIVRNSWSTASDLLEKRAVKIKWEADEEDTPIPKISKYMTRKNSSVKEEGEKQKVVTFENPRCQFFSYRDLTQTAKLF